MSDQTSTLSTAKEGGRPPMPAFLFKLVNPLMKAMLNSPLHGRMSDRLMVLTFRGRKTGKRYSIPVGYVRQGDQIYVFTHSLWRKNFATSAPVTLRIRGRQIRGTGRMVTDPLKIRGMVQALVKNNGEEMSRRMGFWVENLDGATAEEVQQSVQGTYFIEIDLEDGTG